MSVSACFRARRSCLQLALLPVTSLPPPFMLAVSPFMLELHLFSAAMLTFRGSLGAVASVCDACGGSARKSIANSGDAQGGAPGAAESQKKEGESRGKGAEGGVAQEEEEKIKASRGQGEEGAGAAEAGAGQ
eukprot:1022361-Rhodomonas_salina.1